ncbi:GDSL-like lipase/acylhydrolase family protein [Nonomuraea fuscirosea]|uniref:GDSL-like lipase/acylhydrolase family protein n=1 Tax=Nonomuraea fuscirosea TaxID=1291556 RepID=A0A2T0LJY2_9ACTN|nr:SGNH/GDSL hydrolase family protein [Nonomuraea fuscirosea]PRX42918.1 GDSL-like lipase/acylhydrolase family protein [Nonomuraea fuscirosea]
MQSILQSALACVVGAVEITTDPSGVTFHRSPSTARARLGDMGLDSMSAVPAGVRIEALTDASALEFDVELTEFLILGATSSGSAFDLALDGELRDPVITKEQTLVVVDPVTWAMEHQPAGPVTLRFDLGASGTERRVEIWLPAGAMLKLLDVRITDGSSLRPAPATGPLWVHHGSSVSQCAEADRPTGTWPAIVARAAGRSLLNLAIAGQSHLDQFTARAIRDLPATAISLELGLNILNADSMRERAFVSAFHGFLDTIRDGHPTTPIVIVTPIICPIAEDHPGPTPVGPDQQIHVVKRPAELAADALSLSRIRALLHQQSVVRYKEGDVNLHIIDGLTLFGLDDVADLTDGLHPNARGYRRMAARFLPLAFGDEGPLR